MEPEMSSERVMVAVSDHSRSALAVMWTLSNKVVKEGGGIKLIHIRPLVRTIPTPMGNNVPVADLRPDLVAAYMRDVQSKTDQLFRVHGRICDMFKVRPEFLIVESDSVKKALLEKCSELRITKLIVGASSHNALIRKLKRYSIAEYVANHAPNFCTVLVVAKGKLVSVRAASNISPQVHSSPDDDSNAEVMNRTTSMCISSEDGSLGSGISIASTSYGSSAYSSRSSPMGQVEIRGFMSQPLPIQREQAACIIDQKHLHTKSWLAERSYEIVESRSTDAFQAQFWVPKLPIQTCSLLPSGLDQETGIMQGNSDAQTEYSERQASMLRCSDIQADCICTPAVTFTVSEPSKNENGTCIRAKDHIVARISTLCETFPNSQNEESSNHCTDDGEMMVALQRDKLSQDCAQMAEMISLNIQDIQLENELSALNSSSFIACEQPAASNESERLIFELQEAWHRVIEAEEVSIRAQLKVQQLHALAKKNRQFHEEDVLAEHSVRKEVTNESRKCREVLATAESLDQKEEKNSKQRRDSEDKSCQEATMTFLRGRQEYREYSYEELSAATKSFSEDLLVGEGGYGAVYKGRLHHTPVAIKVLKQGSVQGLKEFQQEVELLSHIHHPHMVLLLGACPEKGCLVYEYLPNGSLEDRLFCRGNTPPLPWYTRIRIVTEVAIALLFLHSSKPEAFVHRDLKPANILLDHNFVSKIGDVGLAKLVPGIISYSITEYIDTFPVGTFAYIDPEYQRTGVVCPRSDVYALGIVMLQLLTGLPPVGVMAKVENALENNILEDVLDQNAGGWPFYEAEEVARLALQCTEFRRRDRPDLETHVLPTLERIKAMSEDHAAQFMYSKPSTIESSRHIPSFFLCPIFQEVMKDPHIAADGFTYEYNAIKQWMHSHNTSPMTNLKLSHKHLTPNHSLRSAILEWTARTLAV
eukprot:c28897_g1_i2 orf=297-3086(-)